MLCILIILVFLCLEGFTALADLIESFPNLSQCYFVMVPGPNDPWGSDVLPRPAIPTTFRSRLGTKFERVIFTSNPAR